MRFILLSTLFAIVALGQSAASDAAKAPVKLPADIDPESYSRLPMIKREQLKGDALRVYDAVAVKDEQDKPRETPSLGPMATSLYSLGVALPMNDLNQYIRKIIPGTGMYHLCALIAAREFDEAYEWNSHEGGARQANVDQRSIDAVKFNRPLDGLPAKDALVIRFGRALFRDHKVSSELYTQVVKEFGQQGMFELTATMGDYAMGAMMLLAVDQRVPNMTNELPVLKK